MKNTPLLTQFKESACQCRAKALDGHMFWNPFHSFNVLRFPCHKMRAFLQLKTSSPQWRTTSQGLARPAPAQCFKNDNLAWMVSVPWDLCMVILKLMMRIMKRFVGQTPNKRSCRVHRRKRPACCAPSEVSDHSAQPCCMGAPHVHQLSTWASFVNKVVCWSTIPEVRTVSVSSQSTSNPGMIKNQNEDTSRREPGAQHIQ